MTEPRKAALSLLITILLFAVFTVVSFAGLFDLIETRFYNPSVTAALSRKLSHEAGALEVFVTSIERWFADSLAEPAVKRSFLVNQTPVDIYERSQVFARLHEKLDGLQWVRFIDTSGNRIHYSTWQGDFIREDSTTAVYRMYTDAAFYTPLENLLPLPSEDFHILFDPPGRRIVLSLPFYDALDAYRGIAVFSLSLSAIQNRLMAEGVGQDDLWLIAEPLGLLRNLPEDNMTEVLNAVAESWRQSGIAKQVSVSALESGSNRTRLVLLTAKTLQGIYTGNLVNETYFVFPLSLKILLLALFFVSMFLVLFLLTNIRQDPMTIVQNRLKNLQIGLIQEYYDQKSDIELSRWGMDLMRRREEIRNELRQGLKIKTGKKTDKEIDTYIDKSWNDLLAVIGGRLERTVNEEEIHLSLNRLTNMLTSLVEDGTFTQNGKTPPSSKETGDQKPEGDDAGTVTDGEAVEEIEEIGGVEEIEAVEEIGGVEEVESVEEIGGVEEIAPFVEKAEKSSVVEKPASPVFAEIDDVDEIEELVPVEEDIEKLSVPQQFNRADGETAEDVETLEVEELEELEAADAPVPVSSGQFDRIAREVEWSETVEESEEPLAIELEVSSPFSKPSNKTEHVFIEKNVFDSESVPLEETGISGVAPLFYQPFTRASIQIATGNEHRGLARKASAIITARDTPVDPMDVIREQDGIAYIQKAALHPTADEEKYLDPRIKGLVDSVLKQATPIS
jgi:hypothetical protein